MLRTFDCDECGAEIATTHATQRYCRPCSETRQLRYKAEWAKENPQQYDPVKRQEQSRAKRAERLAAGAKRTEQVSIAWPAERDEPELAWFARIEHPFGYHMSKNAIWRSVGRGHVYLRQEAREARDALTAQIRRVAKDCNIVTHRLWVDMFVVKPNHRGDAINVIDFVCDALKDGIGLDDRWYSIRRLDWSVSRENPRVYIGFGQEVGAVESQVCSYCGNILPLDSFGQNRASKTGRGRTCKGCTRAAASRRAATAPTSRRASSTWGVVFCTRTTAWSWS